MQRGLELVERVLDLLFGEVLGAGEHELWQDARGRPQAAQILINFVQQPRE